MTDHRDGLDEPGLEALLRRHYRQLDPDPVPVRLAASVRSRLSGGGERHDDAPVGRVPVAPVRMVAQRSRVQVGPSVALAAAVILLAMAGLAVNRLSSQPAQASPTTSVAGPSGTASTPSTTPGSPEPSVRPSGSASPGSAGAGSAQHAMAFADRNQGIVVGEDGGKGAVWATSNEGQDWTAVPVDAPPLDAAAMVGTRAWASASCAGIDGPCTPAVLASDESGATWRVIDTTAVISLTFVSATEGWAIAPSSPASLHLVTTTDGGRTWVETPVAPCEPAFFPLAVSFTDAQHGWAACGSGESAVGNSSKEVVATSDGGSTWQVRSRVEMDGTAALGDVPLAGLFRGIEMLRDGTGIAWLWNEGLIRTTDGGTTWTRLPLGDAAGSMQWPGAAITTDGGLFALTVDATSSNTAATFNLGFYNGSTWKPYTQFGRLPAPGASPTPTPSEPPQPATPDAVAFTDPAHGIAVGGDATTAYAWHTGDGGGSWSVSPLGGGAAVALAVSGPSAWTDVLTCPPDAAPGNAACAGSVERSDDGGATWTVVGHANLTSISFGDAVHGFGVGPEAPSAGGGTGPGLGTAIYATSDGGATWTPLPDARPCAAFDPVSVSFVSASRGWVGCSSVIGAGSGLKAVMETTDAGRTWSWRARIDMPGGLKDVGTITSSDYLATIAMAADGSGFITGQRGSTLRTADGGRTWTACPPGQFDAFTTSGAAILSNGPWYVVQSGWLNATLTTTESRLMRSPDRGASWSQVGDWLPAP